jgi:hypothetical protein
MQNKAKVNMGKMKISIATIKDYDKKTKNQQRMLLKTKPNKAKVNIGKMYTQATLSQRIMTNNHEL